MSSNNFPIGITASSCTSEKTIQAICYQFAGEGMVSDVPLPAMAAYALPCTGETGQSGGVSKQRMDFNDPVISTRGWLVGKDRTIACSPSDGGYLLDLSGIGQFFISRPRGDIKCVKMEGQLPITVFEEALLGPPVFYALAMRNVWGLHASGVSRDGKAILFIGASGKGKSTLAAYLGRGDDGFQRITDDASPCSISDGVALVRPHFPQLKVDSAAQYPLSACEQLPIQTIVVLNPDPSVQRPRLDRLNIGEALNVLLNQTIIVTLFDRDLHQAHLLFLAKLVEQIPVYRLNFSHDYNLLPEVSALISDMPGR